MKAIKILKILMLNYLKNIIVSNMPTLMPTKSANNPIGIAFFIFLIPTDEKYKVNT